MLRLYHDHLQHHYDTTTIYSIVLRCHYGSTTHGTFVPRLRSFYTEREHERESDHCDFSHNFSHELLFILKAVKRMEQSHFWFNFHMYRSFLKI
jgi:hypothetical protein